MAETRFGENPLYSILRKESRYVKVTRSRFGPEHKETLWARSTGTSSPQLDRLENASDDLDRCLRRMKSEHDRLRERTHFGLCIATETADMHRALEEFSAATQAYTLYQESDKVDDHYHSEVCFEGGIWASDFQNECTGTGYLWYSCSENRQKFRLDVYSDATIEEITYDQHCDQIQRQAKFKNVISEIRHPNHPYRKMNSDERKVYLAKRLAEEGF